MAKTVRKVKNQVQGTLPPAIKKLNRRVAAYARVSTDSEQQQTSIEAQKDYYVKMIDFRLDWSFAGLYVDDGISGTRIEHRDGFNLMMQDALDGKIDLIVTKSISRFARNTVDSLSAIRKLKEHNVEIFFEKENIWTFDSKCELILTILSSVAQEESRSISENITWGKRKRFADGEYAVPYGRFLGYDRGMVINEAEAVIIKKIYYLFLIGMSAYQISKILTEQGIPTPGGKKNWSTSVVNSILTNEKYKGDALIQKSFTVDFISKKQKKNEGELPKYYVTGGHTPIIPPPLHEYVQTELQRRVDFQHGRYTGVRPFLGRIMCENCGAAFRHSSWHSTTYSDWVWECSSRWRGKKCGAIHIYDEQFQSLLREALQSEICNRTEAISAAITHLQGLPDMTAERQQRCLDELAQFKNKPAADIQLAQADAILAIKTIHIGKQRKMKITLLDDTEIIIDVPPYTPRRG